MAATTNAPENGVTIIDSINLAYTEIVNLVNVLSSYTIDGNTFPMFDILNNNKEYILSLCVTTKISENELMKPEYTSVRLYGTSSLWYLILFVNEMYNATEYIKKEINVLSPANINTFVTFLQNYGQKNYELEDLTITVIPEE